MMNKGLLVLGISAASQVFSPAIADPTGAASAVDVEPLAKIFGQRELVDDISLSPDGKRAVAVIAGPGQSTRAAVIEIETGHFKSIAQADGKPLKFESCGWSSPVRLVCTEEGVSFDSAIPVGFSRTVSFDADGGNAVSLGRQTGNHVMRISQSDGHVIDWLTGDGYVLMTRDYVPEGEMDSNISSDKNGYGVDKVDTRTGRGMTIEAPSPKTSSYIADGLGNVRITSSEAVSEETGHLMGVTTYFYRESGSHGWHLFSKVRDDQKETSSELVPIAVDGTQDVAYAVKSLNGRDAVYRVQLDGSMRADLVASNPQVDVDSVATIGRHHRVIGVIYQTDKLVVDYFDPEYKGLAAALGRALPKTPLIRFISASADEKQLLVFASSDTDPGHYYIFDKQTKHLEELLPQRANLADLTMAPMKSVTFKSADGSLIPAYLTLPPGGATKGLPAIVMPHGGPDYRDEWGFDWLVQFFAHRGYAVLQPEYRGSSGYGDAFYQKNGFHSWQTAIGDVCDAGRWLLSEGIADPSKLAIVGWSYGGYAALQANVLDANLFKAIVAVAPVTDLAMIKAQAQYYTNASLVIRQIGEGDVVTQGSPDRHADRFLAPVLIFHGDRDTNVAVAESRSMDAALHHAGKTSTLVIFPGLDHQLDDSDARAKLLQQSDEFLRNAMKL